MGSETTGKISELSRGDCLELLRRHNFGRLAVVAHGQPLIFPVNYVLDNSYVVFRTDPGIKLSNLGKVAFEVDEIDPTTNEGWSVHVAGFAAEITNAIDDVSVRELGLPLVPWVAGTKDHWVRVLRPTITGRRLQHPAPQLRIVNDVDDK
jgi:uncharacterized protein